MPYTNLNYIVQKLNTQNLDNLKRKVGPKTPFYKKIQLKLDVNNPSTPGLFLSVGPLARASKFSARAS